jgi:PelA/Pel-15E family pectate lyase
MKCILAVILVLLLPGAALAASAGDYLKRPAEWFASDEARSIARNVVSWQTPDGGWAKGAALERPRKPDEPLGQWHGLSTIDNGCTYGEIRLLARIHNATQDPALRPAIEKGIDFLLQAQYPSGGWPQRWPPPNNYGRSITFNDNAMVSVMRLLRDIATTPDFAFVDTARRQAAAKAFERGIDCILNAQIVVDGKPTAWCAQHDPQTLQPVQARKFEPPSISGGESAAIVLLLMDIDHPAPRVRAAIESAVAWYESVKITGLRLEQRKNADGTSELIAVEDPNAPPLWARFYDLKTQRPMFMNRDGEIRQSFMELDPEPRSGYAWLRPWGAKVLERYPKWKAEQAP